MYIENEYDEDFSDLDYDYWKSRMLLKEKDSLCILDINDEKESAIIEEESDDE